MTLDTRSLPLGKHTYYGDQYDPALLVAIPRQQTRDFWPAEKPLPFSGVDDWTGYELSWLDHRGKPGVALARIQYQATSPALVESKSLKLYLNSFNQTVFADRDSVCKTIQQDLDALIGETVHVTLSELHDTRETDITPWDDLCIDHLDLDITQYYCDATLLGCHPDEKTEERLVSHLFRSLCPVTGQPDWASIRIHYSGPRILHDRLLRYLCSFRLHGGFHEQCIERIFCDLHQHCLPERLSVEGRFTRRGGLDINPFRCSHPDMQASRARQVRQ